MFGKSVYKSAAQLRSMVRPGEITAASLAAARARIAAGVSTLELDAAAHDAIVAAGAASNFQLVPGYRHTVCTSVNDAVVHGVPGDYLIQPGDIVSVDSGAILNGWNGDAAFTAVVPDPTRPELVAEREELSRVTEASLWHGIAALARARYLNEVGAAVERYVTSCGDYGILTDYVGHGIGKSMHEDPQVYNFAVRERGIPVKPGLVIAIEPMIVRGSIDTHVDDDDWTVRTDDGLDGAHWEHSVAVHQHGIWVLTASDGGAADLAPFGIVPTPIA